MSKSVSAEKGLITVFKEASATLEAKSDEFRRALEKVISPTAGSSLTSSKQQSQQTSRTPQYGLGFLSANSSALTTSKLVSGQTGSPPVCGGGTLYTPSDYTREAPDDGSNSADVGRSPFRRDYARLIHCPSFRRLQGKTQLFPCAESDFFRNRLSHSIEVAQIAKSIALRIKP